MAIVLDLSPEQEERLSKRAARLGVEPLELLRRLIDSEAAVTGPVDLAQRGVGPEQAADLRARLRAFAPDWERPDMEAYDAL